MDGAGADRTTEGSMKRTETTQADCASILAFVLIAFGARVFLVRYRHLFSDHDAIGYINMARAIRFGIPAFWETIPIRVGPLFPLFIRICHETGPADWAYCGRLVSILFGSMLWIPFFLLARLCYGRKSAIMGSILLLTSPFLIDISLNVLTESTFVCFFLFAVYFIFASYESWATLYFFLAGVTLSLSYLVRPEAFLYFPLFLLGTAGYGRVAGLSFPKLVKVSMAFMAGFAVLSLPFVFTIHHRIGIWTFSGKTKNILLQHGVDKNDALWYEKQFYALDHDDELIIKKARLSDDHEPILISPHDIINEIKALLRNVYTTYRRVLSDLFGPAWFFLMGAGFYFKARRAVESRHVWILKRDFNLLVIILGYMVIVSFHNLTLRHFAAIVPLLVVIGAYGLKEASEFLQPSGQGRSKPSLIFISLLLGFIFVSEIPTIRHAIRNPGSNAGEDSFMYLKAGRWMRENLPPNLKVMSRKGFLSYYAGSTFVAMPFGGMDEILDYARSMGVEYLEVNSKIIRLRPQLEPLLSGERVPACLELTRRFDHGKDVLKLYRLRSEAPCGGSP